MRTRNARTSGLSDTEIIRDILDSGRPWNDDLLWELAWRTGHEEEYEAMEEPDEDAFYRWAEELKKG